MLRRRLGASAKLGTTQIPGTTLDSRKAADQWRPNTPRAQASNCIILKFAPGCCHTDVPCYPTRMLPDLPTIAKAAHDMREGTLRPSDLVEHCLVRIEQLESDVRAWSFVDQNSARREAQRLDALQDDDEWL